ncbi:hypothetical protein PAXRUDRAFT_153338 [Paxillus rubicundulus Ve08.2h10]|uniref:Uncharacterized protein n=1 Tax=Paxillus rubicundulus Ve08.2h10 TaxID=930991 RepID=A0A0D0CJY5_9AGAM|nr:hypothetical protein PAXRUDRAFT_153338 [Paxillus rubicundulus Ve08.2h10]
MFKTLAGCICDKNSNYIDPDTLPPPVSDRSPGDWTPYQNKMEFEVTKLIFKEAQLSAGKTDKLLHIWGSTLAAHGDKPPFADHQDLYNTINATPVRDVPWNSLKLWYNGEQSPGHNPPWMSEVFEFWFQKPSLVAENMISNQHFHGEIDYVPYCDFLEKDETQ